MIQRIQTLFLIAAVALVLVFLFISPFNILSFQAFETIQLKAIPILASVVVLLSFTAIFLFKNRPNQYRVIALALAFNFLLMIPIIYSTKPIETLLQEWTNFLPLASILFLFLAQNAVKKDEKLIRESNRLR